MSLFNTSASLHHVTPLPPDAKASDLISVLHGHTYFIECDPHMTKYELMSSPSIAADAQSLLPSERNLTASSEPVKFYKVTDKVAALPAGVWSSDVESTYEFVNLPDGVFVRIRSPLNVVMETVWTVRNASANGEGAALVEDVVIKCSRVLVGFVKSTCESGWRGIHQKMTQKVVTTGQEGSASTPPA